MLKYKNINIKYFAFIIVMYMLLFQGLIEKYIPFFKYTDEILALLLFPVTILKCLKYPKKGILKLNKSVLFIIVLFSTIVACGLYSNYFYKFQPVNIVLSDLILILKFPLVYLLGKIWLDDKFFKINSKQIFKHVKFIILLFVILTIGNYCFNIFEGTTRYGMKSNQLFYSHPTFLVASCVFLMALITIVNTKKVKLWLTLLLIIIISTLRIKAIGFAAISILIYIVISKGKKKITFSKTGVILCLAFIIAYNQIVYYYFSSDEAARSALTKTSIEIARDYFPIGTGFGTFGSYFSSVSYSRVYYIYNIYNVYGLQNGNSNFISDTFWPMITGQFGIIGLICYLLFIYQIFRTVQKEYDKNNKSIYLAKILCLSYLVISSSAEATFVNTISIPLALILGMKNEFYKCVKKDD